MPLDGPIPELRKYKSEEKLIQCLEVALYLFLESRTQNKQFTEDLYSLCVYISAVFDSFPDYYFLHFG